jgi:L-alanine-DL-glutamate epimerase-like enolase superfamily enzyme
MSIISEVAVIPFEFTVKNLDLGGHSTLSTTHLRYSAGSSMRVMRYAVRVRTSDGAEGAYVTHWVGLPASLAQVIMLAPHLLGQNPEDRELIYDNLKRELRVYDRSGHGPLDIALWDLVGRKYGVSISSLLGRYRSRLPTYASTFHGQDDPGGLESVEAFGEFAVACKERGFGGVKLHGWLDGNPRREASLVLNTRRAVGDDYPLMMDPGCVLRTYADALYVGRACDEASYFWYEDPYRDGGIATFSHKMLREQLKTPLLVSEYIRGLEQKATFVLCGACDMVHTDPEYDMGITGLMKIAHFCEALGIDVQIHACGPAHRACMSAIRSTHFYELALVGPGMPNLIPPVYRCGYSDEMEAVDKHGTVPVPDGPGLGVDYDWDFITKNQIAKHVFTL